MYPLQTFWGSLQQHICTRRRSLLHCKPSPHTSLRPRRSRLWLGAPQRCIPASGSTRHSSSTPPARLTRKRIDGLLSKVWTRDAIAQSWISSALTTCATLLLLGMTSVPCHTRAQIFAATFCREIVLVSVFACEILQFLRAECKWKAARVKVQ